MANELKAELVWNQRRLSVDLTRGTDLAMPLDPHGPHAMFFVSHKMRATPVREGSFIGDVRQGGSCNVDQLQWTPHCHGTHTECIGHISEQKQAVLETIDTKPSLARVFSATSKNGLIEGQALRETLDQTAADYAALIIRTLPNRPDKKSRNYDLGPPYPVFDRASLTWLSSLPLRHLLIDTPSLDRPDNTRLDNHRIWWGENDSETRPAFDASRRSITEMIYVPDEITDGEYWMHLELCPLVSDATPSRPIIYPVKPL